jgi:hypothetical protein
MPADRRQLNRHSFFVRSDSVATLPDGCYANAFFRGLMIPPAYVFGIHQLDVTGFNSNMCRRSSFHDAFPWLPLVCKRSDRIAGADVEVHRDKWKKFMVLNVLEALTKMEAYAVQRDQWHSRYKRAPRVRQCTAPGLYQQRSRSSGCLERRPTAVSGRAAAAAGRYAAVMPGRRRMGLGKPGAAVNRLTYRKLRNTL